MRSLPLAVVAAAVALACMAGGAMASCSGTITSTSALSSCTTVTGSVSLQISSSSSFSFNNLLHVTGDFSVNFKSGSPTLTLAKLTSVGGDLSFTRENQGAPSEINVATSSSARLTVGGSLTMNFPNQGDTSVTIKHLSEVGGNFVIKLGNQAKMSNVKIGADNTPLTIHGQVDIDLHSQNQISNLFFYGLYHLGGFNLFSTNLGQISNILLSGSTFAVSGDFIVYLKAGSQISNFEVNGISAIGGKLSSLVENSNTDFGNGLRFTTSGGALCVADGAFVGSSDTEKNKLVINGGINGKICRGRENVAYPSISVGSVSYSSGRDATLCLTNTCQCSSSSSPVCDAGLPCENPGLVTAAKYDQVMACTTITGDVTLDSGVLGRTTVTTSSLETVTGILTVQTSGGTPFQSVAFPQLAKIGEKLHVSATDGVMTALSFDNLQTLGADASSGAVRLVLETPGSDINVLDVGQRSLAVNLPLTINGAVEVKTHNRAFNVIRLNNLAEVGKVSLSIPEDDVSSSGAVAYFKLYGNDVSQLTINDKIRFDLQSVARGLGLFLVSNLKCQNGPIKTLLASGASEPDFTINDANVPFAEEVFPSLSDTSCVVPTYAWLGVAPTASCPTDCGYEASTLTGTVKCVNEQTGAQEADDLCSGSASAPEVSCGQTEPCDWDIGSWSSCSVTCGDGTKSRTVSCPGAVCSGAEPASTESCKDAICYEWKEVAPTETCPVGCGHQSSVLTGSAVCVDAESDQTVASSLCAGSGTVPEVACSSTTPCDWTVEAWSTCSVACGTGQRSRSVSCPGTVCDGPEPASSEACTTEPCGACGEPQCFQWAVTEPVCPTACGSEAVTEAGSVTCVNEGTGMAATDTDCVEQGLTKPATPEVDCGAVVCYEWHQTAAPTCPTSCGADASTVSGSVVCRKTDTLAVVGDDECAGSKPAALPVECLATDPCYEWVTSEGSCPSACGNHGSVVSGTLACKHVETGAVSSDDDCDGVDAPAVPDTLCPQTTGCAWSVGQWSGCSCSNQEQKRTVDCPGSFCEGAQPSSSKACTCVFDVQVRWADLIYVDMVTDNVDTSTGQPTDVDCAICDSDAAAEGCNFCSWFKSEVEAFFITEHPLWVNDNQLWTQRVTSIVLSQGSVVADVQCTNSDVCDAIDGMTYDTCNLFPVPPACTGPLNNAAGSTSSSASVAPMAAGAVGAIALLALTVFVVAKRRTRVATEGKPEMAQGDVFSMNNPAYTGLGNSFQAASPRPWEANYEDPDDPRFRGKHPAMYANANGVVLSRSPDGPMYDMSDSSDLTYDFASGGGSNGLYGELSADPIYDEGQSAATGYIHVSTTNEPEYDMGSSAVPLGTKMAPAAYDLAYASKDKLHPGYDNATAGSKKTRKTKRAKQPLQQDIYDNAAVYDAPSDDEEEFGFGSGAAVYDTADGGAAGTGPALYDTANSGPSSQAGAPLYDVGSAADTAARNAPVYDLGTAPVKRVPGKLKVDKFGKAITTQADLIAKDKYSVDARQKGHAFELNKPLRSANDAEALRPYKGGPRTVTLEVAPAMYDVGSSSDPDASDPPTYDMASGGAQQPMYDVGSA
eukprot:m.477753 g.477753  ORF g.477753 m.477753 type:complete len:1579 (+) comp20932_c0_seq1:188-4924(+)